MSRMRVAAGFLGIAILASWAVTGGYTSAGEAQSAPDLPTVPVLALNEPHQEKIIAERDPFAEQVRMSGVPTGAASVLPLRFPAISLNPRLGGPVAGSANLSNLQVPGPDGSMPGAVGSQVHGIGVHLYATTTQFAEVSVDGGLLQIVRVGDAVGTRRVRAIHGFDGVIELNDGSKITIESAAGPTSFGLPQPMPALGPAAASGTPGTAAGPSTSWMLAPPAQPLTRAINGGTSTLPGGSSSNRRQGVTGGTGVIIEPDAVPSDSLRPSTIPIHD